MVLITSGAFHEKLSAGEEDIILNGPPNDLRGHIFISNKNTDDLKVKSLPINYGDANGGATATDALLRLSCRLYPGEEKLAEVWHQLSPLTPPGNYESTISVGGGKRKVTMVVQEQIDIDVQPATFTFTGTNPGSTHTCVFTLTNLGNMPFQVPDVKHLAALDMDMLCRAFGVAMRSSGDGGYEQMLNEASKNIHDNLPDWARADIAERGSIIVPGQKLLIHLRLTLPANCDAQKDYAGSMRFWDKDISYIIKSHNSQTT